MIIEKLFCLTEGCWERLGPTGGRLHRLGGCYILLIDDGRGYAGVLWVKLSLISGCWEGSSY